MSHPDLQQLWRRLPPLAWHALLVAASAGLVLVAKLQVLDKPVWWAESAYMLGALKVYENGLNPFVEYWSYKPPLVFLITGVGYSLFGVSMVVPHVVAALFSAMTLYLTFLLGRLLFCWRAGAMAALALFTSAVFYSQAELFVAAQPFTALTLATLYYHLRGRRVGYLICASLLVMTKEPGVLVVGSVLLYQAALVLWGLAPGAGELAPRARLRLAARQSLVLALPLAVFAGWLVVNRITLGWFLWPHNAEFISKRFFPWWGLGWILDNTCWNDFKFLLLIPLGLALVYPRTRGLLLRRECLLLGILTAITVLFYWAQCAPAGDNRDYFPLARYYLYQWPLLYVMAFGALVRLLARRPATLLLYWVLFMALSYTQWSPPYIEENGETDLNQRYMSLANRQAVRFIEQHHKGAVVFADFTTANLFVPAMGYVTGPMHSLPATMLEFDDEALERSRRQQPLTEVLFVHSEWRYPIHSSHGYEIKNPTPLRRFIRENGHRIKLAKTVLVGPELIQIYLLKNPPPG